MSYLLACRRSAPLLAPSPTRARTRAPRAPLAASRADRLDLVARVLADRPGATAADLAAELGVSVRSVFRDLGALRARGYPVEAARGRGGGLRLHPNWGLGRVLLARDEALGTLLGLAVAERLGLPMFAAELGRARRRLAGAFPAASGAGSRRCASASSSGARRPRRSAPPTGSPRRRRRAGCRWRSWRSGWCARRTWPTTGGAPTGNSSRTPC
jgi:biotin operon repressor